MSSKLTQEATAAAAAVSADRLWSTLMAMAEIGARPDGGVCRQALTVEDREARDLLIGWARGRGYGVSVDPAANLFVRRPGRQDVAPVLAGSHMDSQPAGGRFDGIYGVLAAFEALVALDEAGIETERPVDMVAWTNEEAGRFACGCTGSISWSGHAPLEDFLPVVGTDGVVLRDALEETLAAAPDVERIGLGSEVHAYIEPHIEQGPVLESKGLPIAAVTSIQGLRWFSVEVDGRAGHAGTTPMTGRKDAFQGALRAIEALNALMADDTDTVRFTVGRIEVEPNSPNTIPSLARFTVDFRHPEEAVLTALGDRVADVAAEAAAPCTVQVTQTSRMAPDAFPETMVALIEDAARSLDLGVIRLASGAFHDALFTAKACPTAMIFVPCRDGISHHPAEYAKPEDLAAGTRVLTACLVELANRI